MQGFDHQQYDALIAVGRLLPLNSLPEAPRTPLKTLSPTWALKNPPFFTVPYYGFLM